MTLEYIPRERPATGDPQVHACGIESVQLLGNQLSLQQIGTGEGVLRGRGGPQADGFPRLYRKHTKPGLYALGRIAGRRPSCQHGWALLGDDSVRNRARTVRLRGGVGRTAVVGAYARTESARTKLVSDARKSRRGDPIRRIVA